MKVLIISAFPPDPAPEANHALHISEHLAKSGLDVHILCKKGSIASTQPNVVVHSVMEDWGWSDAKQLVSCLRDCRPDVVLLLYIGWVFNYQPMITYLPTYCKRVLPGIPCVIQFENVDKGAPPRSLMTLIRLKVMALKAGDRNVHWLFGTLLRDSTHIIALSTPHRAALIRQYPEVEEKCTILPPPPLTRFCANPPVVARRRAREFLGAKPDDFIWVYWGYIYPGKGIETLLQAFRIVSQRNPKMRLILVGGSLDFPTGPISCSDYYQMVHRLPESFGISELITWTGHFDWNSDEGSCFLYASDACVLPFDYGLTLNNSSLAAATTHGLPVIATELPEGQDEMLEHGRNIYLCPPCDPQLLAEAMQQISISSAFQERLRTGSRELAREWHNWDVMTERLTGILKSAFSAGRGLESIRVISSVSGMDMKLPEARTKRFNSDAPQEIEENTSDAAIAPCVSIVVAVYNVGKYLSQCLDSLCHQTLNNVEIIVVNDASTDDSAGIIDDYKSRYPNIRVIVNEGNKGLATVRNIGMHAARGQYIAFTDGDDWVDTRMCEMMYQRALKDDADVLIADATVFYENSKTFGQFFDQNIRKSLDANLRARPFELATDPRVLLLEPVAWTKLYKRSFLEEYTLEFEDGMNSYEDICFHFSVLLKARRISLIDDALFFYRQNRPGQISGRTNRKVFEVFEVFTKICENFYSWNVSPDIWAYFVKVQLKQFNWLLMDRVKATQKREFLELVERQFEMIPKQGLRTFSRLASRNELSSLFCMRRNWLHVYEMVARRRWPFYPLLYALNAVIYDKDPNFLKRNFKHSALIYRSFVKKFLNRARYNAKNETVIENLNQQNDARMFAYRSEESLFEPCWIAGQVLFLSNPGNHSDLLDAVWRMDTDYYLSRLAVFREGDTVVDVGAYVGAMSIYLAKKYPFIKVYAIEPDPRNYFCLTQNIEINDVKNVIALNKAISGDGRIRNLYTDAEKSAWSTINPSMAFSKYLLRTSRAETITLDQLFEQQEIQRCRLMKITAPGAVDECLEAFKRCGDVDFLCGEVDLEDCNRVKLEIESWRIARQHFWRTRVSQAHGYVYSWVHQIPTGIERLVSKNAQSDTAQTPSLSSEELEEEFRSRGPWVTKFSIKGKEYGGEISYKIDKRLMFFFKYFSNVDSILDLGSLEGGQTFRLAEIPGTRVVGIEGRKTNINRAKWIQHILKIDNVEFIEANLETVQLYKYGIFDVVNCEGVLYHLLEPWKLIEQISMVTDNVFIWTHYVLDEKANITVNGYRGTYVSEGKDTLSGLSERSLHLTLGSIKDMLKRYGFVNINILENMFDEPRHLSICDKNRHILGAPEVTFIACK